MAPLAQNKNRQALGSPGFIQALPVKDGENIYGGALVLVDSDGLAVEAANTAGLKVGGVAETGYDNTDGVDGTVVPGERYCRVERRCTRSFPVAGSPVALAPVFVVDDDHLTTVAGNVPAGICIEPNADISGEWFCYIPGYEVASVATVGTDPGALTFAAVAGTATDTLEAIPDPTDTPGTADALRDDIVANLLPPLRNNLADLADAFNDLRTALLAAGVIG